MLGGKMLSQLTDHHQPNTVVYVLRFIQVTQQGIMDQWAWWIKSRFEEIDDKGLKAIVKSCRLELARRKRERWRKERKVTYSQQKRRNGLYWYAYWTDPQTGKKKSKYIGKEFKEINIE